jgi:hypothetical protein
MKKTHKGFIYNQLKFLMSQKNMTFYDLAERMKNHYRIVQSLNKAYNMQSIKAEGWYEIAEALDMYLVFQLVPKDTKVLHLDEQGSYAEKIDIQPQQANGENIEYPNAKEKQLTNKLIKTLENQLQDKNVIINSLKEQIKALEQRTK